MRLDDVSLEIFKQFVGKVGLVALNTAEERVHHAEALVNPQAQATKHLHGLVVDNAHVFGRLGEAAELHLK